VVIYTSTSFAFAQAIAISYTSYSSRSAPQAVQNFYQNSKFSVLGGIGLLATEITALGPSNFSVVNNRSDPIFDPSFHIRPVN
jgi:hypothetical protein